MLLLSLVFSMILSPIAQAKDSYNCRDLYQVAVNAQIKAIKKSAISSLVIGGSSSIVTGTVGLIIAGVVTPFSLIGMGATLAVKGVSAAVTLSSPSPLEKVTNLDDPQTKREIKAQQRFAKEISEDSGNEVTPDQVLEAVATGIDSGAFCENFPVLYDMKAVKAYLTTEFSDSL